jgi:high-affinity Fe2+/Pb2+ permease
MSENSSIGDLFHTLIGYSDRPTVLQGIVYVIFVRVVSFIFIKKSPERIESLSISNPASLGASSP